MLADAGAGAHEAEADRRLRHGRAGRDQAEREAGARRRASVADREQVARRSESGCARERLAHAGANGSDRLASARARRWTRKGADSTQCDSDVAKACTLAQWAWTWAVQQT